MGFFDFLFGGNQGSFGDTGGGDRRYKKIVAWSQKRVGPITNEMTDSDKENYVVSVSKHLDSKNKRSFVDGLRKYLESRK